MLDFNFDYFVQYLDTNNDYTIQKDELKDFLKTQDKNIFTQYLEMLDEDTSADIFKQNINKSITKKEDIEKFNTACGDYLQYYKINGFKYESDEEFNRAFSNYLNIMQNTNNNYNEAEKAFAKDISFATIIKRMNSGKFYNLPIGAGYHNYICEDMDLTEYENALRRISFNEKTFSNVSSENLPKDFKPKEIFEKGKSMGLGIDDVHQMGYTGKGMSIAIIDSGTMCKNGQQHNALKFKEYYIPDAEKTPDGKPKQGLDNFHGLATSYIAQQIAPDADLYYFAESNIENNGDALVQNLQAIIDKNKTLPDDKKIRVVSLSFDVHSGNRGQALEKVKELESQGVWVFSSHRQNETEKDNKDVFPNFWDRFGYTEKKNPSGDIDDFDNYQIFMKGEKTPVYDKDGKKIKEEEPLYVNSGNITVPDPDNPDAFRHDSAASASWAIPVVAGYYTLACQADSKMTPDKFMKFAYKTARTVESTEPIWNNYRNIVGRTKETTKIKMIDIKALLQAIEQEKNN